MKFDSDNIYYMSENKDNVRERRRRAKEKYKFPEVRMTHENYALFKKQAEKESLGVSTVIGNMALAYLQSNRVPTAEEKRKLDSIESELQSLSLLIRNIANNVNQVAHRSNTLKVMVEEHDLLGYLKNLDDSVKESVHKLNGFK